MPTFAQLSAEPPPGGTAWLAQITPNNMETRLLVPLRTLYSLGPSSIGAAGDNNHVYGRHRSRDWDLTSVYCTNRSYGTTDARDKRGAGNIYRAVDIGISGQPLWDACHRLDAAVRAGQLPGVAEWFGTFNGTTVVGWYEGHASSSDSSHLWHGHIGFWNESADDVATMQAVYNVWTGTAPAVAPMGDVMYFISVGQSQYCVDSNFERYWGFDNFARWTAVRAAAGNPAVAAVTQADLSAGLYGKYQGIYAPPRAPAEVTASVELSDEEIARIEAAAKEGAEAGAPTHDELVAAAEEGANLAEDS